MPVARTTTKLETSPQDDLTSESVCEVRRCPKVPSNWINHKAHMNLIGKLPASQLWFFLDRGYRGNCPRRPQIWIFFPMESWVAGPVLTAWDDASHAQVSLCLLMNISGKEVCSQWLKYLTYICHLNYLDVSHTMHYPTTPPGCQACSAVLCSLLERAFSWPVSPDFRQTSLGPPPVILFASLFMSLLKP